MKSPWKAVLPALALATLLGSASRPAEEKTHFVIIEPGEPFEALIRKAAAVVPAARQLAWQKLEFSAFVHFGMNTFTGEEWGTGREDPSLFQPEAFDARQWVRVFREAGMKQAILTAKHHDGFCLWPTDETDHGVKSSPWRGGKGDVVGDVASACREFGLKFGVYLSPWDRHEPCYGDSPRYNAFFRRQLRELLTRYGEISEVWFDGACGEGPNGKRQVYDWASYYAVVRELQPKAVIFGMAPDVRWVGTETGYGRETEWSVIPLSPPDIDVVRIGSGPFALDPAYAPRDFTGEDLGSREKLREASVLLWYPAESDVSLRPGWFYRPSEDAKVKTAETLVEIDFSSVGRNGLLLLNVPPDKRRLIHENDRAALGGMKDILDRTFRTNFAAGASAKASSEKEGHSAGAIVDDLPENYWTTEAGAETATVEFELNGETTFDVALLAEQIAVGQRVESFRLEAKTGKGWKEFARGTTIGYKRLLRFAPVTSKTVRLVIEASRTNPTLAEFGLYTMK